MIAHVAGFAAKCPCKALVHAHENRTEQPDLSLQIEQSQCDINQECLQNTVDYYA